MQCNILNCAVFITTTCNTETCHDCVGEGGGGVIHVHYTFAYQWEITFVNRAKNLGENPGKKTAIAPQWIKICDATVNWSIADQTPQMVARSIRRCLVPCAGLERGWWGEVSREAGFQSPPLENPDLFNSYIVTTKRVSDPPPIHPANTILPRP